MEVDKEVLVVVASAGVGALVKIIGFSVDDLWEYRELDTVFQVNLGLAVV